MRRLLALIAVCVFVLLGGSVFVAPASAVELPPPVDPLPALPSTYNKTIATGSGQLFQDQIAYNLYVRQQMAAARAAAGTAPPAAAAPVAKAVPVTGVRPYTAAGAGGALTAAFMGGWMITDGTLAMYANATGENPLQQSCQWGDFGVSAVQILYPFSSPDCTVTIDTPNFDVEAGFTNLVGGGVTLSYLGISSIGRICYSAVPQTPPSSPFGWRWETTTATWSSGFIDNASDCVGEFGSTAYVGRNPGGVTGIVGVFNESVSTTVPVSVMEAAIADPGRVPSCQLTWPGGDVTTVTGTAAQEYQESAGLPLADFSALCNDGFVSKPGHGPDLLPTEIEIGSTRVDTDEYAPIQTAPLPELTPDEKKGLTGPATGGGLILQRVVGTTVKSCNTWEVSCANWWTQTANATNPVVSDGYYRCMWNGGSVALAECGPYRNTFDTQTANPTITDPNTGTTSPWTSGTQTGTNTGTFPSTGTNPATSAAASTGGGGCTAGWSWNPVDWVLNPLRCAFIPSQASVAAYEAGNAQLFADSALGAVTASVGVFGGLFNAGDGCGGLPFVMDLPGGIHIEEMLFAACDEPMAGVANVVKSLLTFFVFGGATLAIVRYGAGLFGFNPLGIANPREDSGGGVSFR